MDQAQWGRLGIRGGGGGQRFVEYATPSPGVYVTAHEVSVAAEEQSEKGVFREEVVAAHRAAAAGYGDAARRFEEKDAQMNATQEHLSERIRASRYSRLAGSTLRPPSTTAFGRSVNVVQETLALLQGQHLQQARGHEASLRHFEAAMAERKQDSVSTSPEKQQQQPHRTALELFWQNCSRHFKKALSRCSKESSLGETDLEDFVTQLRAEIASTRSGLERSDTTTRERRERLVEKHELARTRLHETRVAIAKYAATWRRLQTQKSVQPREAEEQQAPPPPPRLPKELTTGTTSPADAVVPFWELCEASFAVLRAPVVTAFHIEQLYTALHAKLSEVSSQHARREASREAALKQTEALYKALAKDLQNDSARYQQYREKWNQLRAKAQRSRSESMTSSDVPDSASSAAAEE